MKKEICIHNNSTFEEILEDVGIKAGQIPNVSWIRLEVIIPPKFVNIEKGAHDERPKI